MTDSDYARLLDDMESVGALSRSWRGAFEAVPREAFVPATFDVYGVRYDRDVDERAWRGRLNSDVAIVTQVDDGSSGPGIATSSTSRPTVVARMLSALDVREGHRVHEIGTGTGWNAALLCARLGSEAVSSVEIDAAVFSMAKDTLDRLGYAPKLVLGDGEIRVSGPRYDRLIATAAVRRIPPAWITHTRPGGIIVAPVRNTYTSSRLVRMTVSEDGTQADGRFIDAAAFMWIRRQRQSFDMSDRAWRFRTACEPTYTAVDDDLDDLLSESAEFGIGTLLPHLGVRVLGGRTAWWSDGISWVRIDLEQPDRAEQYGPRRLWDAVSHAYRTWVRQGRPTSERFGITATITGEHTVWLDSPSEAVRLIH
ncbi:hypothetical protein [Embleya sp. NPDC055610]